MTITWERQRTEITAIDTPRVHLGRQVAIIAAAVGVYFLARGATEAAFPDALLNWVYIWGHWPVIVITLIWLARNHAAVYYRTRNAMILSGSVGMVIFTLFPVAPPRLAELGLVDTVTATSDAYRVLQPAVFTNQYAAMPSLHVGWDLLMGIAIAVAARRTLVKALGVAMPVAMVLAVVLTANHYIIDVVAGAALTTAAWFVARPHVPAAYGVALANIGEKTANDSHNGSKAGGED